MQKYNAKALKEYQKELNILDPVDLAEKMSNLTDTDLAICIKLLDKDLLADAFALLDKDKKAYIIESLSDTNITSLIDELDADELVDTLQELPASIVRRLSRFIDEDKRAVLNKLLGYPKESVGSIMSVDFLSIKDSIGRKAAIRQIKQSDLDANRLEQIWITDNSLILKGYVYIADILRLESDDINSLIHAITRSVYANDDQEVVAKLAYKYDLSEIPVTDSEGRLIGTVPVEWAVDVMHEEYEEDMAHIHGINESDAQDYWKKSSFQIAKERTMWLVICLITATFTGFIIHRYEDLLSATVVLTAYIPMLMDSGGNAGTQASTTIIRALYAGEIKFGQILKVVFKEAKIGIFTGIALIVVNMIRICIFDTVSLSVNLTVSITLLLTIMLSKIIGGMLPLIADKLKIDPTIMAGPLITTIVDTFVLLVYFEVATLLLGF